MVNSGLVLTPLAKANLKTVVEYLLEHWSEKSAEDFLARFEYVSQLIIQFPSIYPYIDNKRKVQRCVLTKHNIIYFRRYALITKIITIFDTRQSPEKLMGVF